jgi:hypothetical protein
MAASAKTTEESGNLRLDPVRIVATVAKLRDRVHERFPDSGLNRQADDLVRVARGAALNVARVARPHMPLRAAVAVVILLLLVVVAGVALSLFNLAAADSIGLADIVQTIEAALNELVLVGASIFFLITFETRVKRKRTLGFLRELRALAHIVDMHQLTKDPERISDARHGSDTASSPTRHLTPFELGRYLDYCSEMLSLISKIAALYIQNFDDPVVLAAVDEVETLTTGLARKIWQKIMILDQREGGIPT